MSVFQRLEMLYRPSYSRQGLATVPRHRNNTEVVLTNFTNNSGNSSNSSGGDTDQDGFLSPTFQVPAPSRPNIFFVAKIFLNMTKYFSVQDILNRTRHRAALPWRISLKQYYYR